MERIIKWNETYFNMADCPSCKKPFTVRHINNEWLFNIRGRCPECGIGLTALFDDLIGWWDVEIDEFYDDIADAYDD